MSGREDFWGGAFSKIHERVGDSIFELWFKPMKLLHFKDKSVTIEIPNRFFKDWVEDNYPNLIGESIEGETGQQVAIKFKICAKEDGALRKIDSKNESRRARLANRGIYLNPKYTFDSFVVGSSNQFAHAAAKRVCEGPGSTYNPLFIYGGVGLGKTHLINAIGNEIVDKFQNKVVYYVSAEQFTNEVISSIRHEKMGEFKDKYRNADILLVDDIQFIAGKTATQEEFFHTFNSLYARQSQIVISSDRAPMDISDITDRLRSRFGMGLIADIQCPEVETKVAILYKKADAERLSLPEDVAYFIASRVKSNIRELEGCLIKLGAHSSLTGIPIDMNLARNVLKDLISDEDRPLTVDGVVKVVSDYFGVKPVEIKGKKRTKEIVNSRQIAMYLLKNFTQLSLSDIGRAFGGKDHATVIYGCRQVEERRSSDDVFNKVIENIIRKIKVS
ncbi:MAG TPA: chromosomal replication initiator protein DnaA [Dissulfurispiraceae bacterium]|nr:chromosomal replication initiator protein DnaA [Dissulfurispiraceae bacterium]